MTGLKKYIIRFGGLSVVSMILLTVLAGLLSDKVRMVLLGFGIAELIWALWFKPIFGKVEALEDAKLIAVLLFRGILIAAIILGLTIGM
ncbi:MAG: hypothetical protein FD156_1220 [Nitrospirae bacterium]|nr:MAG: hypothetical protein FD156_1220 [Nitrospirota bacterium]